MADTVPSSTRLRTLPVRFADVVTLPNPCDATPAAVRLALRRRLEGRVHPHGYILPGSLQVAAQSAAECGLQGRVTFQVWVAAQVAAPVAGDVLPAGSLRVLVASPLGALCAVTEADAGHVWVYVPVEGGGGDQHEGRPLPFPVRLAEVVQRTGADFLLCIALRAPQK